MWVYVYVYLCAHVCNRRKKEDGSRWSGQSVIGRQNAFPSLADAPRACPWVAGVTHVGLMCGEGLPFQSSSFQEGPS